MANIKHFYFIAILMAAGVLFYASCDLNKEEEKGNPWDGKEVIKMNPGSGFANWGNGIPNVKKDEIYWYYIDAHEDMTYSINMNISTRPLPYGYAKEPAFAEMTGYKEDGTVIGIVNPHDEGTYANTPITFYSIIDQKIYICFKIISSPAGGGYFVFGYNQD